MSLGATLAARDNQPASTRSRVLAGQHLGETMAVVLVASVTDDAAKLTNDAIQATQSAWGRIVDKGKAAGKVLGGLSFANSLRQILNDDTLSPAQKAKKIFDLHGYSWENFQELLPPRVGDDTIIVIDKDGVVTVIPPQWINDP